MVSCQPFYTQVFYYSNQSRKSFLKILLLFGACFLDSALHLSLPGWQKKGYLKG